MENKEALDLLIPTQRWDWQHWEDYDEFSKELIEVLGEPKLVGRFGGSGDGEKPWNVLYFPKVDLHVRQTGYYSSYDGADFKNSKLDVVQGKEKTIIAWETV